jgi:hypothetical protein
VQAESMSLNISGLPPCLPALCVSPPFVLTWAT